MGPDAWRGSHVRFPPVVAPRASVVILAWRALAPLVRCLEALERHLPAGTAEVVILMNGAYPDVARYVGSHVIGATVVSSSVNLGFAGGCNRAVAASAGEYVVLLNDDTEIQPGWLEALIDAADGQPSAGAIGSRILFPDGSLQEAGCIVWKDGSTMPVGRGAAADAKVFMYRRRVDYCSACSLLVRRAVWDDVGGMDESFYPGYYEDAALCLSIRQAGGDVLYEPRSRVVHLESTSSETGFRDFVFTQSRRRFIRRWSEQLAQFPDAEPTSPFAIERAILRTRGAWRRVLVIDDRVPDPSAGSGFARMHQALQELATPSTAVSFFASNDLCPDPTRLGGWGIETLQEPLDHHLARAEVIYDAVLVSRPHNYTVYADVIRRLQPQAALVYDAEALFWRRLARHATLTGERASVAEVARAGECRIAQGADHVICISPTEAKWFRAAGARRVEMVSPFWPEVTPTEPDVHARQGILYVAGWLAGADSPNGDGLSWFVREVLPYVRRTWPDVRVDVTGHLPEPLLAATAAGVRCLGHVPDLASLYAATRVVICPVRYGAGVKLKVVEGLQYGVPVVTTSIGVEGIQVTVPEAVRCSDTAPAFAAHVTALLADDDAWRTQRDAVLQLVADWRRQYRPGRWRRAVEGAILARDPAVVAARAAGRLT